MKDGKALLVYIEPTPYILGLVSILNRLWPAGVDVFFLKEDESQSWGLELDRSHMAVLPDGLWRALRRIDALLAQGNHGVLHLAGWSPLLMPAAMLLARPRGVPVTVESDTPLPYASPLWKRAAKRLLYPAMFRLPALFLPGGKRQAACLRHYGVGEQRIVRACMTVDVAAVSRHVDGAGGEGRARARRALGLAEEATVFLYVGRLEPHKGVQDLVEAFGLLDPGPAAALLLVGEGSLRETIGQALLADARLRWPGRLSGTVLLDAYAAADVFVLPSRFEPWGLVVNEAMAAGLPVIATERVGCADDLVLPGETGLLVPAESPRALAGAMRALLADRPLRAQMAQNARRLIAGWTLEHEAEIIAGAWKQVLNADAQAQS